MSRPSRAGFSPSVPPPLSEPQPFAEGHGLSGTTSPAHTLPRNFSSPWSQLLLHPRSRCNRPYARPQQNHEALSPVDISDRQTDSESLGMLKGLAPPSSQAGCLNLLGMASVGAVTQSSRWCFEPLEGTGRRNLLKPSQQIQRVLLALPDQASWDPNTQDEVHLDITCH